MQAHPYVRSVKEQKFSKQSLDDPHNTFFDGKWDGKQGFEPEPHQCFTTAYRKGYLSGVAERLDDKFAQ